MSSAALVRCRFRRRLDDTDPKHYGLNGSPTQVKRIFPPDAHVEHVTIEGDDTAKAAQLADLLESRKFLQ